MDIAILPDTNVLLHYPPLDQIDWLSITNEPEIRLVICLEVVKELDAKKSDPALGERAKRAIREIRAGAGRRIRTGVTLEVFNEQLRISDFPASMSPDSADDRIVFYAKRLAEKDRTEVRVATEDLGMELRCAANAIGIIALPNELRLAEPASDLLKREQKLTAELQMLRAQLPKLTVRISDENADTATLPSFILAPTATLRNAEDDLLRLRERYLPLQRPRTSDVYQLATMLHEMQTPSAAEYHRYNERLEEFFAKWPDFIEQANAFADLQARTVMFHLWLTNDGSVPAEDVDLKLSFPAERLSDVADNDADPLRHPPMPAPPEKPKASSMFGLDPSLPTPTLPSFIDHRKAQHDGVQWVRISVGSDEFTLTSKVRKLKHHHRYRVATVRVTFKSWSDVAPVQLQFVITAANHPERLTGTFALVVRPRKNDSAG